MGDPASSVPPSEVLDWSRFWSELDECGRDERPQLIRVPRLVLGRRRKARHRDEEEALYPRHELVEIFRQSEQSLAELQGRALELETLEPDGNGNFRVAPGYADNIAGSEPGDDDRAASRKIAGRWSSSTHAGCSLPDGSRLLPGSAEDLPVRNTGTVGASGKTPADQVYESRRRSRT